MATKLRRSGSVRRLHVFSLLLGIWLVVAPFVLHYSHTAATANEVVIGLLISFFSFVRLRSASDSWTSWAIAGISLWLVLSPFIFGYTHVATYWNEMLFGLTLLVIMFSALGSTIRHHSHLAH